MKCTSRWLEAIDAIGRDYHPWGIHEFGEICVGRTFVTTRRVGKDTVTTRRVGKDYCALRASCRSGPSAIARQWFEREISWGIYSAQLRAMNQWPLKLNSSTLQSQSSCWGILLGGSMLEWSGMEWLHWMEWRDGCLTHLSSVSLTTMRARAWFFRLVHGWSSEQTLLFTMLWDVFCGSCWFFCQRCKLHCTTTKVLPLYGEWHCLFITHVSSACFQSGLFSMLK